MFILNSTLEKDSFFVTDLKICRVLLMNNSHYPWLILVPREPDLIELTDLSFEKQIDVLREINLVSDFLQKSFLPTKINIATLGNIVRQLHIHVIARFETDISFPKPVWGGEAKLYNKEDSAKLIEKICNFIAQKNIPVKEKFEQVGMQNEKIENLIKKVLYRAIHRGCKETDFLIGEFAKEKIIFFDEEKLNLFKRLIEEDDLLIYDWILAKQEFPIVYKNLILEIRQFHNLI